MINRFSRLSNVTILHPFWPSKSLTFRHHHRPLYFCVDVEMSKLASLAPAYKYQEYTSGLCTRVLTDPTAIDFASTSK